MKILTTGKVAKLCDVSPRTVTKWHDQGLLDGYRLPGGQDRRFTLKAVHEFLVANKMPQSERTKKLLDKQRSGANA